MATTKKTTTTAAATKKTTTTAATKQTAQIKNAGFDRVLESLRKASGWEIIGDANQQAALSSVGTRVMLAKDGSVDVSNLSFALQQIVSKTADAKTIARVVSDINDRAKKALTTKNEKEKKEMAQKKATAPATKQTAPKEGELLPGLTPPAPPEKIVGKPLVNPAGEATPVFDALKKNAETDEKAKEKLTSMWENFGGQYDFKVGNLTKALLAEGLWPAAKDKDGAFKADEEGNQVPVGYQKVYKEEREQGVKGVGHLVNVAAASFGRHNMAKAATNPGENKKGGPTPSESTPDEKTLAKRLNQIEKLALNIDAEDLKNFLEASKAFAPALALIKEQESALDAL